jgi:hypothetical protein
LNQLTIAVGSRQREAKDREEVLRKSGERDEAGIGLGCHPLRMESYRSVPWRGQPLFETAGA